MMPKVKVGGATIQVEPEPLYRPELERHRKAGAAARGGGMKTFCWLFLSIMFVAGEASGQVGTGQSGVSTSTPVNNVRPFQELQAFGTCLARSHRKAALELIATLPGSREEDKVLRKFVFGEHTSCLFGGTQMAMPDVFARGAVAEGLLRADGIPDTHRLPSPSPTEVRDLHGAARCYTASHRTDVEKLLQTKPGGPEEVKAVAALWDEFRACMPNFKVRLNAPWIRFLLAEALLRVGSNTTASGQ
jgi:hypothetical protein